MIPLRFRLLTLIGLWTLALPQGLLDLVGQNPAFLVAHSIRSWDVILFVGVLVLVPPLLFLGVEWSLRRAFQRGLGGVRFAIHSFLFGLILLPYLRKIPELSLSVALTLVSAFLLAWLHEKWTVFPQITALLSVSALIVVGLFLAHDGVRTLLRDGHGVRFESAGQHSVSVLILDELSLVSLLNEQEEIDAERFPNFAALAATSTWYRNATTAADLTEQAVPSLLTGIVVEADSVATEADHPINLYTLLGDYELYASEPITLLSPDDRNRFRPTSEEVAMDRWTTLGLDLLVVSGHLILPAAWAGRLPSIDQTWVGFWRPNLFERLLVVWGSDRREEFSNFLAGMKPGSGRQLNLLHSMLPHIPWSYFPDGRRYPSPGDLPGVVDKTWVDSWDLVEQGRQRYRWQLQMVDGLVGEWMDRQKELGLWEDSVVALVADHGVSFKMGESRRLLSDANAAEVLNVPCFIKGPNQREGRIDDTPFSLVEVLGELLRLAEVSPSVLQRVPPTPPTPTVLPSRSFAEVPSDLAERRRKDLRRRIDLYLPGQDGVPNRTLSELTPYLEMEERSVPLGSPLEGVRVFIDDPDQFRQIDAEASERPALLSGTVRGFSKDHGFLAVAVDGLIRGRLALQPLGGAHQFWSLLPPEDLGEGAHHFSFYGVAGTEGGLEFHPIVHEETRWALDKEGGQPVGLLSEGRHYPFFEGEIQGRMDMRTDRGSTWIHGWAWDSKADRPVDRIVLFAEDQYLTTTFLTGPSPEAAKALGKEEPVLSGFQLPLDLDRRPLLKRKPVLLGYAITHGGEALRLTEGIKLVTEPVCEGLVVGPEGETLRHKDGSITPFSSANFEGRINGFRKAEEQGYGYLLSGWSVDEKLLQPASHVLVFHEDQCIYETLFFYSRQDIVDRYQDPGVRYSRFFFWLNQRNLKRNQLKVVAVSPRGIARELPEPP